MEDYPLALCNAFSVDESTDLVPGDRVTSQNVGEVYYIAFNPRQDWYWLSRQTPDEMTVFVSYDSSQGIGPACKDPVTTPCIRVNLTKQVIPHGTFRLQSANENGQPRESLEARFIVVG